MTARATRIALVCDTFIHGRVAVAVSIDATTLARSSDVSIASWTTGAPIPHGALSAADGAAVEHAIAGAVVRERARLSALAAVDQRIAVAIGVTAEQAAALRIDGGRAVNVAGMRAAWERRVRS